MFSHACQHIRRPALGALPRTLGLLAIRFPDTALELGHGLGRFALCKLVIDHLHNLLVHKFDQFLRAI
jgi:hypothetical protein